MGSEERYGSLEISENDRFQRSQLLVARGAVAAFLVLMVLSVLGLFGSGPLSYATAGDVDEGLAVDYQRFLRFDKLVHLDVRLSDGDGPTELAIDRSYLRGFQLGSVTPEPDAQTSRPDAVVFTFRGAAPSVVTFALTPRRIGVRRATVSVDEDRSVSFSQLVYP